MDRYLIKRPSSSTGPTNVAKKSKKDAKQGNITADTRSRDYPKGTFTVDAGLLYCRICNTVIEVAGSDICKPVLID